MKVIHFCAGLEGWNGMANTALQFVAEEQAKGYDSQLRNDVDAITSDVDQVVIHGAWLPVLWRVSKKAKKNGARLVNRPAGSYDPVRLSYHGWKKKLVSSFEHRMLRRADVIWATCEAEEDWIRAYEPNVKAIEIIDLKRFFDLNHEIHGIQEKGRPLHLLYLGRRHPLKGLEYFETAIQQIQESTCSSQFRCESRIVSNASGEELEHAWVWCDVLVLPTLSENFGRVVAEALERGKQVITTDGAPAWGDGNDYGGRLVYLKGFRDGTREFRVKLLKDAISSLA